MSRAWAKVGPFAACRVSPELGDDLDGAYDVLVELLKILGRNPVLQDALPTDLLEVVLIGVVLSTSKRVTYPTPLALTFQSRAILLAYSSFKTG